MTAKLRPLAALAWTILIFSLCWTPRTMLPVSEEPSGWLRLPNLDKVVHFALFAGFSILWAWAGVRTGWVVALGLLVAVVSELGQATAWVNRDAEWADGTADFLGVLAGLGALRLARRALAPASPLSPSSTLSPSARTPSAETP